jgi:hypothetical protein
MRRSPRALSLPGVRPRGLTLGVSTWARPLAFDPWLWRLSSNVSGLSVIGARVCAAMRAVLRARPNRHQPHKATRRGPILALGTLAVVAGAQVLSASPAAAGSGWPERILGDGPDSVVIRVTRSRRSVMAYASSDDGLFVVGT